MQNIAVVGLVYRLQFCFFEGISDGKILSSCSKQESKLSETSGQGNTEAGEAEIKGFEERWRGEGERNGLDKTCLF